ncbi:hypothetical protein [Chitinophaga sp. CB10]|uniref:LiaF transmembrane domain-containing protein n=1 Tax=Chitinophaga sp. CB10 TaxID=1891659 RepID=UPI0025BF9A8F|nr:hypothetical protein [Chitinophaga sp. CB10]
MANTVTVSNKSGKGSSSVGGVFLAILGVGLLLHILHVDAHLGIPHWIHSWQLILMVIGLLVGMRRNFRGTGWAIMMGIGAFFFIKDILHVSFYMDRFFGPVGLIILGVVLISRRATARKRG